MEREQLQSFIDQGLSQRKMAAEIGRSQATVKYWLKKYELKQHYNQKGVPHLCKSCGETDPGCFYGYKRSYCGSCHNKYAVARTRQQKLNIIALMGSECKVCGYKSYPCSLHVHHLDPSKKDPTFMTFTSWKWERIIEELKHCILLCANCHAAVHAGYVKVADGVLAPS